MRRYRFRPPWGRRGCSHVIVVDDRFGEGFSVPATTGTYIAGLLIPHCWRCGRWVVR